MMESELMVELTSLSDQPTSDQHTIESSSEVQKAGVTPTRQTPDLMQDIIKGHFQTPGLGQARDQIAEPDNQWMRGRNS